MAVAAKISPEGNSYRLDPRDRIILEFSRPMRAVLERFQREDGGWDLKVTLFELDDDSWEKDPDKLRAHSEKTSATVIEREVDHEIIPLTEAYAALSLIVLLYRLA